jgi:phosphotransferase family enzyme
MNYRYNFLFLILTFLLFGNRTIACEKPSDSLKGYVRANTSRPPVSSKEEVERARFSVFSKRTIACENPSDFEKPSDSLKGYACANTSRPPVSNEERSEHNGQPEHLRTIACKKTSDSLKGYACANTSRPPVSSKEEVERNSQHVIDFLKQKRVIDPLESSSCTRGGKNAKVYFFSNKVVKVYSCITFITQNMENIKNAQRLFPISPVPNLKLCYPETFISIENKGADIFVQVLPRVQGETLKDLFYRKLTYSDTPQKTLNEFFGNFGKALGQLQKHYLEGGTKNLSTVTHYDLSLSNVMFDDRDHRYTLIDLDFVKRGHPLIDPIYFAINYLVLIDGIIKQGILCKADRARHMAFFFASYLQQFDKEIRDSFLVSLKSGTSFMTQHYDQPNVPFSWESVVLKVFEPYYSLPNCPATLSEIDGCLSDASNHFNSSADYIEIACACSHKVPCKYVLLHTCRSSVNRQHVIDFLKQKRVIDPLESSSCARWGGTAIVLFFNNDNKAVKIYYTYNRFVKQNIENAQRLFPISPVDNLELCYPETFISAKNKETDIVAQVDNLELCYPETFIPAKNKETDIAAQVLPRVQGETLEDWLDKKLMSKETSPEIFIDFFKRLGTALGQLQKHYLKRDESTDFKDDLSTITHYDFKLDNVMFDDHRYRFTIIDLDFVNQGHPLIDPIYCAINYFFFINTIIKEETLCKAERMCHMVSFFAPYLQQFNKEIRDLLLQSLKKGISFIEPYYTKGEVRNWRGVVVGSRESDRTLLSQDTPLQNINEFFSDICSYLNFSQADPEIVKGLYSRYLKTHSLIIKTMESLAPNPPVEKRKNRKEPRKYSMGSGVMTYGKVYK